MSITSLISGNVIYTLFDDGLANFLGLETLRHGTNIVNYISIRILGLLPSHGYKSTGGTRGWNGSKTENESYVCPGGTEENLPLHWKLVHPIIIRNIPRIFCFLAGYNLIVRPDDFKFKDLSLCKKCTIIFFAYISAFVNLGFTPTLKFRFANVTTKTFHKMDNAECITKSPIKPLRIGLLGTVLTGINFNWFARVRARPMKALTGVVQLTAAVALSTLCVSTIMSNPVTIGYAVAGMIIA